MVFLGKNNSGKSNIMIALESFFTASVSPHDFLKQQGKMADNLQVTVHFIELNKREKELYKGHLINEGVPNECLVLRLRARRLDEEKIDIRYESMGYTVKLESKEAQNRYGALFQEDIYKSVSNVLDHNHVPKEFKDIITHFTTSKGSKRLSKQEYTDLRDAYVAELLKAHPTLAKQEFKEIKITSRTAEKMLGNYYFIPAVQDVEQETKYTAKGQKNLNHLMNHILDQMQDAKEKAETEKKI